MIRPVEEKTNPGEYVNRVKRTEHDHAPGSRDFAYEIGEVSGEKGGHRQRPHDFGEDTYEHADEEQDSLKPAVTGEEKHITEPPPSNEGSLDITV